MEQVRNSYETLFIVDVTAGEETVKATVQKFTDIIEKNAEIVEVTTWGQRRLAYPINDKPDGFYTIVTFKAAPDFPAELERLYNIDENVMRSLVVRLEFEAVKKAAPAPEPVEEAAEEAPAAEAPAKEAAATEAPATEAAAEEAPAETPAEEA